ncbi:MAG: VWA domain-containing protein [Chromatiales bacterium]|nr:MAG: VWA domain-containing protein [Chromatiales bacterium]
MLADFFFSLRDAGLKPSITEYLTLLEALKADQANASVDDFYYLSRATLVKDEALFDRFDRVFGVFFKNIDDALDWDQLEIPLEWLRSQGARLLSEKDRQKIEAMGGWEQLLEEFRKRAEEQEGRHQGGDKWIGTGGTSPYGHDGYHPEGIRVGGKSRHRRAVKVWEKREFRNLDSQREIGTRNLKLALRRLRRFAREGAADQLDLDGTIDATARNAGYLDLKMVPERHNAVKVLLCLDVGGSMNPHVRLCEQLFSAARAEFKHLEYYYFHNCVYENLWRDNRHRRTELIPTAEVLHKYGPDYKLIFVGDASMSPYELAYAGGSVEHWNDEPGALWLKRLLNTYAKAIWLNPEPEQHWRYTQSVGMVRELLEDRMYPMTLQGLDAGIRQLQ